MFPARPPRFSGEFHLDEARRAHAAGASGILAQTPAAVAMPRHARDLVALVRWAAETRAVLLPRGAGTGMPGGNVGAGVVVDMVSHFRQVYPRLPQRRVEAGPGAILAQVNAAAAPARLHLPVDPSSGARCTLGGMIANNSAGAHSVRYGATRAWVEALQLVLADGTAVTVRRGRSPEHRRLVEIMEQVDAALTPERDEILRAWPEVRKNSSGYALREYLESGDVVDLLVGSEGTLALVTGAELRLAPRLPAAGLLLLEFTSLEAAGEAVASLLPLRPATCEMLDRTFLDLVRSAGADAAYPLHPGLEALLLVEVEAESPDALPREMERMRDAVEHLASGNTAASDPQDQHRLWEIRHAASPLIAAQAGSRVSMQFIEDGVVPVDRLPDYVRLLRRVLREYNLPAVIFGHAGDGNLHVNPLVDVRAPRWQATIEAVLQEVATGVAALGGTLAGEHGDGRLRAPLLETIWGADMVRRFRRVKEAFDPRAILNPGVILPLPGQRPFDALRPYR